MKKFSDYLETIACINRLGNGLDTEWLFYCGMLFSSREKWWGDFKQRLTPHEGIDICWYRTENKKKIHCFTPCIRIPAMDNGIILNVCDDFLGQTLVVEYENPKDSNLQVIFTYSHIIPEPELLKHQPIQKDQVIAKVCDTKKNPLLPPHLHFSCFEILHPVLENQLTWDLFTDPEKVNMIHPVFL